MPIVSKTRNLNKEYQDTGDREYSYAFDYVLRDYMMQTLAPFLEGGRTVELGCYKGEFTKKLSSYFDDIKVIEGASDLIEEARKNVGTHVRFLQGCYQIGMIYPDPCANIYLVCGKRAHQ